MNSTDHRAACVTPEGKVECVCHLAADTTPAWPVTPRPTRPNTVCIDGDPECAGPSRRARGWSCPECDQAKYDADDYDATLRSIR